MYAFQYLNVLDTFLCSQTQIAFSYPTYARQHLRVLNGLHFPLTSKLHDTTLEWNYPQSHNA